MTNYIGLLKLWPIRITTTFLLFFSVLLCGKAIIAEPAINLDWLDIGFNPIGYFMFYMIGMFLCVALHTYAENKEKEYRGK